MSPDVRDLLDLGSGVEVAMVMVKELTRLWIQSN